MSDKVTQITCQTCRGSGRTHHNGPITPNDHGAICGICRGSGEVPENHSSHRSKPSRQWLYALRKKAEGNCVLCGKKRGTNKNHCDECLKKVRATNRRNKGFQPWHPGGVGRPPKWAKEAIHDIEAACGVERVQKAKELFSKLEGGE